MIVTNHVKGVDLKQAVATIDSLVKKAYIVSNNQFLGVEAKYYADAALAVAQAVLAMETVFKE
jgi:hypothetical protein